MTCCMSSSSSSLVNLARPRVAAAFRVGTRLPRDPGVLGDAWAEVPAVRLVGGGDGVLSDSFG